jgi:hypothetical protein
VYYSLIEMVMGSRVDGHLIHAPDGKKGAKAAGESREDTEIKKPNVTAVNTATGSA